MRIEYKKSWWPWRQVKDEAFWQEYIDILHADIALYELALEKINAMRPKSRRNTLAHDMAEVALEALTPEVTLK